MAIFLVLLGAYAKIAFLTAGMLWHIAALTSALLLLGALFFPTQAIAVKAALAALTIGLLRCGNSPSRPTAQLISPNQKLSARELQLGMMQLALGPMMANALAAAATNDSKQILGFSLLYLVACLRKRSIGRGAALAERPSAKTAGRQAQQASIE